MVNASQVLDRLLVLEMVRVTEAAAVAASHLVGRGGTIGLMQIKLPTARGLGYSLR